VYGGDGTAGKAGRVLQGLLRQARGGAGAADRRGEERPARRPAVGVWLLRQRLAAAPARGCLRPGGAVPRSQRRGAGGGVCLGGHAPATAVEGARGGGPPRAAGGAWGEPRPA